MAYYFIDDGAPEAEDYDSNYFYFDENDPASFILVIKTLMEHKKRNLNENPAQSQQLLSTDVFYKD